MCAVICVFHDSEMSYISYCYVLLILLMDVFYKRLMFIFYAYVRNFIRAGKIPWC